MGSRVQRKIWGPYKPGLVVIHQEWGHTQNTWHKAVPQMGVRVWQRRKGETACCLAGETPTATTSVEISHSNNSHMHSFTVFKAMSHRWSHSTLKAPPVRCLVMSAHVPEHKPTWRDYWLHSSLVHQWRISKGGGICGIGLCSWEELCTMNVLSQVIRDGFS